ncbi:MAG: 5'-methylthioadenosine/adenosylhomocysteine nucleosidase [Clostridia bacterium]|nr:5'-methylthioadenosine/adenosylhomocysteine nucleosidase [Clostridia bacterium]
MAYDIGVIGAMEGEVAALISRLSDREERLVSGIRFYSGSLLGKSCVICKCGIGKVFAAIAAEAMILNFAPRIVVNTGVGGAIDKELKPLDIVFASELCQHDMDTSPLGDPKGLVSGINRIFFEADERAVGLLSAIAAERGIGYKVGRIASGDRFIATGDEKSRISHDFGALACEMEGASIAQVAFVNGTPFAVVRAISDSADGDASMDYMEFLPKAEEISTELTLALIERY